jgi:Tfp pilus assembly protein PilV
MQPSFRNSRSNSGQTLIETLVAIFILVMGITSAVGLAIYAFASSTTVTKQIVATGLAREGIEAVKNMRDTNWLSQTAIDKNCYNYASSTAFNSNCYTHWLDDNSASSTIYCINPSTATCNGGAASSTYALGFDSNVLKAPNFWILLPQSENGTTNYGLNFNPANASTNGFYNIPTVGVNGVSCTAGSAGYCRKIIITKLAAAPYNQATLGPLIEVQSQVWWLDKKCPKVNDWPGLSKCSVELDTYLTNWKDY